MSIIDKLAAPFRPEEISWRVGSTTADKKKGMALAYLNARDVMRRFDEVCGPFGWQSEHIVAADGKKVTCRIGVKNPETGEWIWKSDGAGETDVEGEKGSYSDALKRAAVTWSVGRYLYDMDSPWVELKPAGRSYAIADGEHAKLRALLTRKAGEAPKSAEPSAAPKNSDSFTVAVKALPDGTGSDWPRWKSVMLKAIGQADTATKLDKLMADNQAGMDGLRQHVAAAWGDINTACAAKRHQLEGKKAA